MSRTSGQLDLVSTQAKLQHVLRDGGDNGDILGARLAEVARTQDMNTGADVTAQQTADILDKTNAYHSMTDLVGQMTEAYNANKYAGKMLMQESGRVERLNLEARKEVYKMQQAYLGVAYRRMYFRFLTNIILFTAFVTCFLLIITAMWRQQAIGDKTYLVAMGVVLVLYSIVMVIMFAYNSRRRKSHWRQFDWTISDDMKEEIKNGGGGKCRK